MNVNKIQGLAEQHKALKAFHKVCCCNGAELTVKDSDTNSPGITLKYNTTRLILPEVQDCLLRVSREIEATIIREAH